MTLNNTGLIAVIERNNSTQLENENLVNFITKIDKISSQEIRRMLCVHLM